MERAVLVVEEGVEGLEPQALETQRVRARREFQVGKRRMDAVLGYETHLGVVGAALGVEDLDEATLADHIREGPRHRRWDG